MPGSHREGQFAGFGDLTLAIRSAATGVLGTQAIERLEAARERPE